MLYAFGKMVTYWMVRLFFSMRYEGLENIPTGKGFILASNHRTNFDPLFIAHKVPARLYFMSKAELFKNPVIGWLLKKLGAFPIERGKGDTQAMDTARGIVEGGGILVMFPEGHRSKDGTPGRGRSGVAVVAKSTGADVLPVAVAYGRHLGFRVRVTVRYGPVLTNAGLGLGGDSPSAVRTASKKIMGEIVRLIGPELPPKSKDPAAGGVV